MELEKLLRTEKIEERGFLTSQEILEQEKNFTFKEFLHHDAWIFAEEILKNYHKMARGLQNPREIGVRVVIDDLLVFQYLMENKKEDNWLMRKQRTVALTKHSTLYLWARNREAGEYSELANDENYIVGGGGFPLVVNGQLVGLLAISGLPHDVDHRLIVYTLEKCKREGKLKFM